jgi:hypothetical protein
MTFTVWGYPRESPLNELACSKPSDVTSLYSISAVNTGSTQMALGLRTGFAQLRFRTIASLCRQTAAFRPGQKWTLLEQAYEWERERCGSKVERRKPNTKGRSTKSQAMASSFSMRFARVGAAPGPLRPLSVRFQGCADPNSGEHQSTLRRARRGVERKSSKCK